MEQQEKTKLNWSIYDMCLYLSSAVVCIPEKYKQQVFNNMAYRLMEWNDTPRSEFRDVFDKFGIDFEEYCIHCNEEMPNWFPEEEGEEPECKECLSKK
jgi:hypothetical protein